MKVQGVDPLTRGVVAGPPFHPTNYLSNNLPKPEDRGDPIVLSHWGNSERERSGEAGPELSPLIVD